MSGRCRERLVIDPRRRRHAVVGAIRTARERLVLSIFRCDDWAVLRALAEAARRGVQVSVLMTARARAARRDLDALHAWLATRGIDVRRYSGGVKYHAKYLVADDRLALVTTLNFTARCFERTCDFALITPDPAVIAGLSELFAADWTCRPARLTDAQRERLIVGPEDGPRERFAGLVGEARQRLRILDAKLTDARIAGLLDERQRAGIAVEYARRRDLRPLRRHGKLLIVDSEAAVIGSFALSSRALDCRRELAIVTRDRRSIAGFEAFWRMRVSHRRHADRAGLAAAGLEMVP